MRLLKISREASQENLLDEALAGLNRPELGSEVTRKFWLAISKFLEDAGLDKSEIEKIRDPYKKAGCVLDEFKELGF